MKIELNRQSTYLKGDPLIIEINTLGDLLDIIDSHDESISLQYSDLPECTLEVTIMDEPRSFYS